MNTRRLISILAILCILPLLFVSCQTYTSAKGKAIISPTPSLAEDKVITKYSVLIAEQERLQEQQRLAEEAQRLQEREQKLADLSIREQELESTISFLNAHLKKSKEENQELLNSIAELIQQKDALSEDKQLTSEEASERISALKAQNLLLNNQIFELQSLIEEHTALQQQHAAERLQLEQEIVELEQAHQKALQAIITERDALATETRMLKTQLEEKTLTIEEKTRLEQARADEARRIEEERIAQKLQEEAEQHRLASLEQQRQRELEEEWKQIPPLSQITYPRLYKTGKPTILATDHERIQALMLPLNDLPWTQEETVIEVQKSISDLDIPIIFVTGHPENILALVRSMRRNAALFQGGAIITDFPIQELGTYGVEVQFQENKKLRLLVANLPEYEVVKLFSEGEPWQESQKSLTPKRLEQLSDMLKESPLTVPTLLGASLYEPSYRDWNTFSPVEYRQIDYLWPLSDFLENEGFYDIYRLTHFSEATDMGNTLITPVWKERVDYLYSRKILPLSSTMLTIGGESAPDQEGIARFAVLGTFLIP